MYFCIKKKRMSRIYIPIIAIIIILTSVASCKDQKTYADYLRDEERAIDQFIVKNNLNILSRFPANGNFGDNDFYKDPESEVYYNIVSYGDTTKNISMEEKVYVRFEGLKYFMVNDSATYNNLNPHNNPFPQELDFIGPVNATTRGYYTVPGWAVPLTRVGHNGVVKMIVPFNMGSSSDRQQYQAAYYDRIEYRFESRIND